MKGCGIYIIENHFNEVYVGASANLKNRYLTYLSGHKRSLCKRPIDASITFHGLEKHKFTVIEICTEKELQKKELEHIVRLSKEGRRLLNVMGNCKATKYVKRKKSIKKRPAFINMCRILADARKAQKMSISYVAIHTGIKAKEIYDIEMNGNGNIINVFKLTSFYNIEMKFIQKAFK